MQDKKTIVVIKTVKYLQGRDKDGKALDEVINAKLEYPKTEFYNFIENVKNTGVDKVEVLKVTEMVDGERKEVEIPQLIKDEVSTLLKGKEKPLTDEQKRIAELEAKIEALLSAKEEPKKEVKEIDPELDKARKEYMEVFGKKGHHSWDVATIREKIEEEQAK